MMRSELAYQDNDIVSLVVNVFLNAESFTDESWSAVVSLAGGKGFMIQASPAGIYQRDIKKPFSLPNSISAQHLCHIVFNRGWIYHCVCKSREINMLI